nr:dihydroorotate dehydrogenase-like protein [Inmirania thermothiophila]
MDLGTDYLGLRLRSPLVPSASPLTRSLDTARRLEDAGAGAVVMYSLFEEDLAAEEEALARFVEGHEAGHAEASGLVPPLEGYRTGRDEYLEQLRRLKEALEIPVIASLNGTTVGSWLDHGRALEEAGADALELNLYYVAADPGESGRDVEARYVEVTRALREAVSIPIAVKLGYQLSAIPHLVRELEAAGADAVVLFNRFYQPDIDLERLEVVPVHRLSTSAEALLAIRWIAILYGRVRLGLAATGGLHTAEDVLKVLLAGADAAQLCSVLLREGPRALGRIREDMVRWMEDREYASVAELRGSLSQRHVEDPAAFERANYMKVLSSYEPAAGVWR